MKPLADHGTTARAKGRPASGIPGCPCRPCRDAENRYDKRRRYLNATGRTIRLPVEPIAQHLDTLFEAGAGWAQLADATGVSASVISHIRRRLQPVVHRDVATRILAAQPGDAIPPGRPVPATGSIRRIHALMADAHTVKAISAATGVEHSLLSDLISEYLATVTRHVADRIAAGYEQLANTPGNSTRSRNRATRNGWHDTAYWQDMGHIDDPNFDPDTADRPRRRIEQIAEDAHWLLATGLDRDQAAERLGISRSYVDKALREYPTREEIAA